MIQTGKSHMLTKTPTALTKMRPARARSSHTTIGQSSKVLAALALILLTAVPAFAQLGTVAPVEKRQWFDDSGNALAGGKIYYYACGTTTLQDTYTTSALSVANANPVVLDAAGRATVYLTPGLCYKVRVDTSADVTLYTQDNVGPGHGVGNDRLRVSTHSATLATGAFTATYSQYAVDTESAAATDDLDTITAGTGVGAGSLLVLTPANVARVVTVKHSTGNIELAGGDYALSSAGSSLTLYYDGTNWVEVARAGGGTLNIASCDGRLTLTTGVPVTSADVTGATTIYFAPYQGNRCALYDGASWAMYTFTERSLALGTLVDATNYDVFLYNNAGTLTLELTAWTDATTRTTALTTQDGVYVKTGATTRRYLGTIRTTATTTTEDSAAKRFVWNYYHRVLRPLRLLPTTDTWTYTTNTYRQANADTANQVAVVVGVAEVPVVVDLAVIASGNGTGNTVYVAIGEDSTTTPATASRMNPVYLQPVSGAYHTISARLEKAPTAGYHFYVWLEKSAAAGVTTWRGDGGATGEQSGLLGRIEG